MSSSYEKSVKGATKIKAAPPKAKYIEHILVATHSGESGIGDVFRALQYRLRDSTWTVVFKSLVTVHLMIREGSPDATLQFLAKHRNALAIGNFSDAQTQGRNIRHYAHYLMERARSYRDTNTDWTRVAASRLERVSVEKGLLRETESVQRQIGALVKCGILDDEPENEITIAVFRLLVLDLLSLYQVLNQGLINILGHFFEMSKTDAQRAMSIYHTFTKQTDQVVQYLSTARMYQHHTRVEVPKLKHAPVHLGSQLEDYLNDPDFEVNRRQYVAEQDAKKSSGRGGSSKPFQFSKPNSKSNSPAPASNNPFPIPKSPAVNDPPKTDSKPLPNKGPDPDLIDFFESIEQNQTTMQVNPQPIAAPAANNPFPQQQQQPQQHQQLQQPTSLAAFQPNGFAAQPTGFNPNTLFQQQQQQQQQPQQVYQQQPQQPQQLQPSFTGAGFGGFTPQPSFQPGGLSAIPQDSTASFQNQFAAGGQGMQQQPFQTVQQGLQPQPTGQIATNPFRQSMLPQQTGVIGNSSPFGSQPPSQPTLNRQSTNPFARSPPQNSSPFQSQPPQQQPLQIQPTGNPFARSVQPQDPQQQQLQQGQQQPNALAPQPTGVTNPFRHGAFVDHQTGMGWQNNQQPIGGGLDQVPTMQVFPRPSQQTPWQQ